MDDRRFTRGAPSNEPPSSADGADQDTLARLEKQLDIDEGARFYDWHGHALTGPERRAHLEAFRSNRTGTSSIPPSPDSSGRWAPPDSGAPPPDAVQTAALVRDVPVEPPATVDVDVDDFESDQRFFAIDSAAPVFALRPEAARPRRSGRPLLVGLFALCLVLVGVAVAGVLRSDIDKPVRHNAAGETPPATLVAPVGLSAETPAALPPSAEVTPAAELNAAPATSVTAASAPAAPADIAPKPAQDEPPVRAQDEQRPVPPPSPPIQKPTPSPSPPLPRSLVPNDTPKF
jgi:hypothetical protein